MSRNDPFKVTLKATAPIQRAVKLLERGALEGWLQRAAHAYDRDCDAAARVLATMATPFPERDVERWAREMAQRDPYVYEILKTLQTKDSSHE